MIGANFGSVLARRILQKALNEALTSDTTYIACTVSNSRKPYQFGTYQPGVSCDRDQSGPPDLKACVDGDACYLYRWKEYDKFNVINLFRHEHNDKPLGIGEWSTPPYFTNASDIIISSVRSALENLEDFRIKKDGQPLLSTEATSLSDIAKASTPGTFKVPVCYSDYNWNTPLKTTKKNKWWQVSCSRDDPYCHEHKLPCYCGPWGSQTQSVWKAMGIAGGFTQKQICGRNIASRVSNPLEHYVALCRLNIHRNLGILGSWINGWVVFKDADKNCDKVIGILENFKFGTFEEIPSDIKWVMYCKVLGTLGDETRCDAYNYLWDEITKPGAGLPKSTLDMETVREEVKIFESEFARLALENAEEDDLGDDDA